MIAPITTSSRTVIFSLDGVSNVSFSWIHLSEDLLFPEGGYTTQPFDDELEFELSCGNGIKTVYARAINELGLLSNVVCISFLLQLDVAELLVYPPPLTTFCDELCLAGTKSAGASIQLNGEEVVAANDSIDWSFCTDLQIGTNTLTIAAVAEDCEDSESVIAIVRIEQPDPTLFTIDILEPSFTIPINDSAPELLFTITDDNGDPADLIDAVVDGYGEIIVLIDGERLFCGPDTSDECAYGYGYGYGYGDIQTGRGIVEEGEYQLRITDCGDIDLTVSCLRVLIDCVCACSDNLRWTGLEDCVTNFHFVALDDIHIDERGFVTGDIVTITNQTGIPPRPDAIIVATSEPSFSKTWGACEFSEGKFGA